MASVRQKESLVALDSYTICDYDPGTLHPDSELPQKRKRNRLIHVPGSIVEKTLHH